MAASDPGDAVHQPRRLSVAIGVAIILGLTLVLVVGVSAVLFELDANDDGPPEVLWEFDPSDPPVLTHDGGDTVECDRVFVGGDLGSGASLCTYFDGETISEGDSAELTPVGNETGQIVLEWEDREIDQRIELTEPFAIE